MVKKIPGFHFMYCKRRVKKLESLEAHQNLNEQAVKLPVGGGGELAQSSNSIRPKM